MTNPNEPVRQVLTRAEQREVTHKRILCAARDLFLTRGFASTSLAQIGRHAGGLTYGAVLNHFASKEDVALAVLDDLYRQALQRIQTVGRVIDFDQLVTTVTTWCCIALSRPGWIRLELDLAVTRARTGSGTPERILALSNDLATFLARAANDLRKDISAEDSNVTAHLLLTGLYGVATQSPESEGIAPAQIRRLVELILCTFTDSLRDACAADISAVVRAHS